MNSSNSPKRFFLTGTMRTGGSLLINLLSVHSDVLVLNERVHFFRYVYGQINPFDQIAIKELLELQNLRLKYRNQVSIDVGETYEKIASEGFGYRAIYDALMANFARQTGKVHWGEYTALAWRRIPNFLELYPEGKVLHVIRDPRAVLASWKKLSSIPNNAYLNAIFNWIDSASYAEKFSEMDPSARKYKCLKYEDLMTDPETVIPELCDFLEIEMDPKMLMPEVWQQELKKTKVVTIPRSAHDGPNVVGFSEKRIANWKQSLSKEDIHLVDFLCSDLMKHFAYDLFDTRIEVSSLRQSIERLQKNPLLIENLKRYIGSNEGSPDYPSDPTHPTSWGAPGEPSKWFVESEVADQYFSERAEITNRYKTYKLDS